MNDRRWLIITTILQFIVTIAILVSLISGFLVNTARLAVMRSIEKRLSKIEETIGHTSDVVDALFKNEVTKPKSIGILLPESPNNSTE